MSDRRSTTVTSLVLMLLIAGTGRAQSQLRLDENLDFDRPESWAMKYFASLSLFTGFGVPQAEETGSIELGLELDWIPSLSEAERTVGFNGTKEEDLNRTEVLIRPRLDVGLPQKLTLSVAWVPPIELFDVEPNIVSLGLGRPLVETDRWRLGLRLFGQYGTIDGDFTCTKAEAAAGDDPQRNPFGCEQASRDEVTIESASLELSVAYRLGQGEYEPYLTLAASSMDLEFQVNARYSGIDDQTRLLTDGSTYYFAMGVRYLGWRRARLGVELFYAPLDVVRPPATSTQSDDLFNARSFFSYALR